MLHQLLLPLRPGSQGRITQSRVLSVNSFANQHVLLLELLLLSVALLCLHNAIDRRCLSHL